MFIIYNKFNKNKYTININKNGLYVKLCIKSPENKLIIHLVEPQLGQVKLKFSFQKHGGIKLIKLELTKRNITVIKAIILVSIIINLEYFLSNKFNFINIHLY